MKKISVILFLALLGLSACSDHKSEAKKVTETKAPAPEAQKAPAATASAAAKPETSEKSLGKAELTRFYQTFRDGAKIDSQGKPMLLVFGQSADPYTQRLQKDVNDDPKLAEEIRKSVTPIYLDAMANKRHKFMHSGQAMDVDTRTLVSIYHIDATPTLIFTDEKGSTIFIVPGYMPPKQFEVTLQFVREGVWKGKDRKNGDVYKALKSYYEAHGVKIGGAKK